MSSGLAVGALVEPPFWAVGVDGAPMAEVEDFLLDFWACGNAESSCRAYAFGLLRWFRHLQIAQTSWERATRTTVRDFVLACKQPSALSSRTLKPRTINHNLAVVSEFYRFQLGQGRGPVSNPVPQRGESRRNGTRSPEAPFRLDPRADLRQRVPQGQPQSLPESRIAELFRILDHPRDRALLEFYLSSAARPSELLAMTFEDVDPGQQQITVTRKGTRARQALPASPEAFVWLALYQQSLPPELLAPGNPVWWTTRRPLRQLNYDAARAILRRAGSALGKHVKLHDLRHTAAAQMAQDSALSLSDIQRVLGHVHLSTTQHYLRQHDSDVLARVIEHLQRRNEPRPPPSRPPLAYDPADLHELTGDDAW